MSAGVLLVEARRPPGLGETNAEPFPFIAGHLNERGLPCRWLTLRHGSWAPAPSPFLLDLGEAARARLIAEARRTGASHLLLSEAPAPALRRFLSRALPGTRVAHTAARADFYDAARLSRWLGVKVQAGWLPDLCAPSYAGVLGDADQEAPPPAPLIGSTHCFYAAPLSRNPAFRGVSLAGIGRKFACSFCPGPADLKYRYRTPPVDLALRQIAALRAEKTPVWSRTEFVVRSASVFFQMPRLLEGLKQEPPLALYFSCRADEVLARRADIEAALSLARASGHSIHIFSLGAENLSAAENERFNKGLGLPELARALALLRGWERDYPKTFFFTRHGGLGFILFTPWTALADLRANLDGAKALDLAEDSFLLTRRLMLFDDMPLTRLAERDGLVDPKGREDRALFAWLQAHCDPGCRHFHSEADRPWRFRDPATARVCALAVRLAKRDAVVAGDRWHGELQAAMEASGVRVLDAFALLLKLAEKRPAATLGELGKAFLSVLRRLPSMPQWRSARDL